MGYVLSRLVFPAGIAFTVSVVLIRWFSLTVWPFEMILLASLLTCLASVAVALLLFAFSHNRVEGMAVGKLSGLLMLGLPVPFFLPSDVQYLFSPLPSFWITKLLYNAKRYISASGVAVFADLDLAVLSKVRPKDCVTGAAVTRGMIDLKKSQQPYL